MVHPNIFILSSLTQPQVATKLYEFVGSGEHKIIYFDEDDVVVTKKLVQVCNNLRVSK